MRFGGGRVLMRIAEEHEIIEAVFVEMDPMRDGFAGVLIELVALGESYALVETAAGSDNRLLEFRNQSRELARSLFEAELRPAPAYTAELDGEATKH
jgi:hypothetical protein